MPVRGQSPCDAQQRHRLVGDELLERAHVDPPVGQTVREPADVNRRTETSRPIEGGEARFHPSERSRSSWTSNRHLARVLSPVRGQARGNRHFRWDKNGCTAVSASNSPCKVAARRSRGSDGSDNPCNVAVRPADRALWEPDWLPVGLAAISCACWATSLWTPHRPRDAVPDTHEARSPKGPGLVKLPVGLRRRASCPPSAAA